MIDDIKRNIDSEIRMLREISLYMNKIEFARPSEKQLLMAAIESLRENMGIVNDSLPALLSDLSAGKKGKRYILPNAEVMIHQPLGGVEGQATDIAISAKHILKTRDNLNKILAKNTGKSLSQIEKDVERDFFMDAEEAKKYGIVDEIVTKSKIPTTKKEN